MRECFSSFFELVFEETLEKNFFQLHGTFKFNYFHNFCRELSFFYQLWIFRLNEFFYVILESTKFSIIFLIFFCWPQCTRWRVFMAFSREKIFLSLSFLFFCLNIIWTNWYHFLSVKFISNVSVWFHSRLFFVSKKAFS